MSRQDPVIAFKFQYLRHTLELAKKIRDLGLYLPVIYNQSLQFLWSTTVQPNRRAEEQDLSKALAGSRVRSGTTKVLHWASRETTAFKNSVK